MYAKGFYGTGNDEVRSSRGVKPSTANSLPFCDFCSNLVKNLEDLFPFALSLGMTYDLYWYGECETLDAYIKKEEYDLRRKNKEFHLWGQYMVVAIQEAMKTNKNDKIYPNSPFPLDFNKKTPMDEQEKIENDMKAMFSNFKN